MTDRIPVPVRSVGLKQDRQQRSGFMVRLARDSRGTTLAMMAALLLPLAAFCGCAIDTARLYVVKARLQQACDAGVLAGRKSMTDVSLTNTTLDATATAQAQTFFNNNFRTGWFKTASASFTPSKTADAQVAGAASANVPMTIMTMFGFATQQINVTCQASYDIADTDVIFVLDTTGSMACLPSDDDSTCNNYVGSAGATSYSRPADGTASGNDSVAGYPGSTAYYVPEKSGSRMAALRSAVMSFYDTMASAADPSTHIRYGFVTYTSTVNAGKAITSISPSYMVGGSGSANSQWGYQSRYQTGTWFGTPTWRYQQLNFDVRNYVAGNAVIDPSKTNGSTNRWAGCIEERATTAGATSFSQTALPPDLDPDLVPGSNIDTQWRPMWPELFYARNNYGSRADATSTGDSSSHPNVGGAASSLQQGFVSCGKPVARLKTMTRTQVSNFVNATDFRAIGGTYHDVGMIWGTRLISPTGIFADDTAAWPARQAPNRVIVFLTDGDMSPNTGVYGMYGNEYYDRRVSNGDFTNLKAYHNARFLAECSAAKARNIQVWTVQIDSSATNEMKACATTTSQALFTTTGSGLSAAFTNIAKQVAMLRVSQ
ncbi:Tad domain-containing protein [Sphingomonas sp. HF-S4]|uniref:Tad domain-containing protein n=1 Tax=Sphingomonas agrestis TaxID=3080540 RepID=A0ABU3Y218_9SPHN|nr:Tad domain-containing protein [Sphingomonas sp. HF-S4]MDV3455430.1 Tad domain-containing protein [Sphingomonas sp. HF-S4]